MVTAERGQVSKCFSRHFTAIARCTHRNTGTRPLFSGPSSCSSSDRRTTTPSLPYDASRHHYRETRFRDHKTGGNIPRPRLFSQRPTPFFSVCPSYRIDEEKEKLLFVIKKKRIRIVVGVIMCHITRVRLWFTVETRVFDSVPRLSDLFPGGGKKPILTVPKTYDEKSNLCFVYKRFRCRRCLLFVIKRISIDVRTNIKFAVSKNDNIVAKKK